MGLDLNRLLEIRLFQAFDVDESGRVLAGSDDTGSTQLIEIADDGAVTPLTALPGACTGRYVPGRRGVIVSHDEGGNERYQLSLLRLPRENAATEADLEPLVRDPRYMHTLADVAPGRICYLTNRRNGAAFDPVIRDLADGTERIINIGDHRFEEAIISPDGRWLALAVASPVTAAACHVALVDLTVPAGGEQPMLITPSDAPAMNRALGWTPDSDALIFSSSNDREFIAVARYDLADQELTWLVTDDTADLTGWLSPDGTALLVERNDDGASELALYEASAPGLKLRDLPLPAVGTVSSPRLPDPRWAPDSRRIALSISSPELPGDALLLDVGLHDAGLHDAGLLDAGLHDAGLHDAGLLDAGNAGNQVRRLTHSACAFGDDVPVPPEQHRVQTADGELVPCRVYRRPDQGKPDHAGLSGSAVLVVHGGPELQARQDFDVVVQALAAAGHTVLVPNVRGSTGYGKRWYTADDKHRRLDSVADLAALHAYLPKLGVDQRRAALWGGSYGGYMVLAGLAFQPGLWAAGVDIVGIASLVTFLENTSAYRRAYREREYGTLKDDREFLREASPLTHIDDITAPLFIIHGANDPRVPLSEAEQIHAAMTARGRECELLVYGDEGHGLTKRANRADAMPRAFEFLARHLGGQPGFEAGDNRRP